jgi:hypothetical protein
MTAPCLLQTTFSTTRVTLYVVCVRTLSCCMVYDDTCHVSMVYATRHVVIAACRRHVASCTLYACAPRPCCDIVHDVTTKYVLLQRTVAVQYTVLQCSAPPCCTLYARTPRLQRRPPSRLKLCHEPCSQGPSVQLPTYGHLCAHDMHHTLCNTQYTTCNLHATFST